jgi:hypothetical protein
MTASAEDDFNGMAQESLRMLTSFLKPMLDFSKEQLEQRRGFSPFAAYLNSRNELSMSMMGEDDHSEGAERLSRLAACVRGRVTEEGAASAVLCYDCRVIRPGHSKKADAVCTHYEDELGEKWDLFFPYLLAENGAAQYQPWHYDYGETLIYETLTNG